MKTLVKLTLLAAGLAAALPFLQADDPAAAAPAPKAGKHAHLRALVKRRAVRQRLAHRLGLSQDQTTQLKSARAKTAAAVKAIRANNNLTAEQKKTQVRDALKTARIEMRGVLTADQQAKLRHLRARLRARG